MEGVLCIGFVVLVLAVMIGAADGKQKQIEAARQAYLASLTKLKQRPTDPDLKQRTLELGRVYSNLTRNQKGVTVFDEVALSNDINAACAAAAVALPREPAPSPESRLAALLDLRGKGLVNEEEYQEQRAKILREI